MTQQDDITQPVLTDEEINAACDWPASNTTMRAENDRAMAREVEAAVLRKLSKLRAPVADESPMAKMADALREKARQEQQTYQDRRAQATEWGPLPEGTEADLLTRNAPVAHVAGDETSRYLDWAKDRSAWEMPVGTPVYYSALASAPVAGEAREHIEQMAVNRYRLVPDGAFSYKVVAGDGTRSLYTGTKDSCLRVAAKLTEAFLDGAFAVAHAAPQASAAITHYECGPYNGDGTYEAVPVRAAPQDSEAVRTQVLAALESAQRFIRNGIEFGYIRMPDADTPDPAHRTPSLIDAAIRSLKTQADKDGGQQRAGDDCKHARVYRAGDRQGYACPDCGEFVSDYEIHRRQRSALSATQPEQGERDE